MRGCHLDFSGYELSGRYYAGSERKVGIRTPDGACYMLKFRKATEFGRRFNHVSEYLGSHIFSLAGMSSQDTYLGTYQGEPVVAYLSRFLFSSPSSSLMMRRVISSSGLLEAVKPMKGQE